MKKSMTDADMQFKCPMCGVVLKQIDDISLIKKEPDDNLITYGCLTCGYIAFFNKIFLKDYFARNRDI